MLKVLDDKNKEIKFTDEEQIAIEEAFKMYEDYKVKPEVAEELWKALIARGLSQYAADKISESHSSKTDKQMLIEKAIRALKKAYMVNQFPVYLYDLAYYFGLMGKANEGVNTLKRFLEEWEKFKPSKIDEAALREIDINVYLKEAKKIIDKEDSRKS